MKNHFLKYYNHFLGYLLLMRFQEAAEFLAIDEMTMDCLYDELQMIKESLDIASTSSGDKSTGAIEKWRES